jgi:thioester reductase-like protein
MTSAIVEPGSQPRRGASRSGRSSGRSRNGVLLTGASGFLGTALLARYLERTPRPVYALVRASSNAAAGTRMRQVLSRLYGSAEPFADRVVPVRGDLARPRLGLARSDERELRRRVGEIVHCGATVAFDEPLEAARSVNLEGTRRVLELAEGCSAQGGLHRLTHVSTAFVSGDRDGCISEDELDVGQSFRNTYEQSKFEAEQLLATWRGALPLTVVRPSIVVGERDSGWTVSFNVLYWPLRAFARGAYVALPGRSGAAVDVVPVDYVADAILALSRTREAAGATVHLTASRQASTLGELSELASAFFGRPAPRLIDPRLYRTVIHPLLLRASGDERRRRALRRSELFFPYFDSCGCFDNRRASALLHGTGTAVTPIRSYFKQLVEFALAVDWGRREIPRTGPVLALHSVRRPAGAHRQRDLIHAT